MEDRRGVVIVRVPVVEERGAWFEIGVEDVVEELVLDVVKRVSGGARHDK